MELDRASWIMVINQLSHQQMNEIQSANNAQYWIDYFSQIGGKNAIEQLKTFWPDIFGRLYMQYQLIQARETGNYTDVQEAATDASDYTKNYIDDQMQQEINNGIATQNTQAQWAQEEKMRDTSLLSSGEQLQQLGLSTSGVLSTGAANVGQLSTASNSMTNIAQKARIEKFEQQMSIAKSVIGLTGSLASSGIYGHAIGAARNAAAITAAATAHSANKAIQSMNKSPGKYRKDVLGRYNTNLGGFYSIFE